MSKKPCKLLPLNDRVLVRRDVPPDRRGNILLPESARKKVARGEVLAAGEGEMPPGWDRDRLTGRVVVFQTYAGSEVPDDVDGHELLVILRSDEILAVVE